jgi:receptor protein-tyrosine kinase
MGRIDEALRRANQRQSHPAAGQSADLFVSPWQVGPMPVDRRPAHGETATPVIRPEEPTGKPEASPADGAATIRVRVVRPTSFSEAFRSGWREKLSTGAGADQVVVDQFRRLAAMLLHAQRESGMKSVMITSAAPADGKTLTALNLALILSESYRRRVLLVEADLRRPVISDAARLSPSGGLSEVMRADADKKVSLLELSDTLCFIPAGQPDPDPLSGLTSSRMQRLLHEASEQFEWVIVDTPPLGATADASLLCPMVDATVLVVRAGHTPHAAVQAAIDTLGRERIFGVVLNQVRDEVPEVQGYYGYSEGAEVPRYEPSY